MRAMQRTPTSRAAALPLTTEEALTLRRIATSDAPNFLFPTRLERHFQASIRVANRQPRVALAFMSFLVFVSMPLWLPFLLTLPPDTLHLMTLIQAGVLAPLFALVTWQQLKQPDTIFAEIAYVSVFAVELVAAEYFRYIAETSGVLTEPLMAICIPIAVLTLSRLPIASSLAFVIAYFVVVGVGAQLWPEQLGRHLPTTWMLEILVLMLTLLSAIWGRLSFRQQWAANVLTEVMAYRDGLTGLANRRAFEDHYDLAVVEGSREGKKLAVALLDLDHFKRLNDLYGHDYGDGALVEVALELSQFAQGPNEMAARLGGEEFAFLLYDSDEARTRSRLGELLQNIRDMKIPHSGDTLGILTCSIGAAIVRLDQPLSEAYREADEMLYQVKHGGRNNYALAE